MAGEDLSLRAVLEAVLDAKGFEEFKKKIEETAKEAKKSGEGVAQSGGEFSKLGKSLPTIGFNELSVSMVRNSGIQQGLAPLIRLTSVGLQSLAKSAKLSGAALGGATLGLAILIPMLVSFMSKSKETGATLDEVKDDTNSLVDSYEDLRKKGVELTAIQKTYLGVLKEIQAEERELAEKTIQKHIDSQEKLTKSTFGLWSATKLLVVGNLEVLLKGEKFVPLHERMFNASEKARKEVERSTAALAAMKEAHEKGANSAAEFAQKQSDAADESKRLADIFNRQITAQFKAFWDQQRISERLALDRSRKAFQERTDSIAAGLEKNKRAATEVAEAFSAANEQANRAILRNNVFTARTAERAAKAAQKEFEADLDLRVEGFRKAKLSESKIAKFVEGEKARFAQDEAEIERQLQEQRVQSFAQGASQAIGILSSFFGDNKALQAAQAIVNTASAAAAAIAPPNPPLPFSAPFLALALATGAAQLAAIQSAEPSGSSGFDDPVNDLLARDYGRRWAEDFSREVGVGFSSGLRDRTSGSSVINESTTINRGTNIQTANFSGLSMTPSQALRDLERQQIRVRRVENRTRRRSSRS